MTLQFHFWVYTPKKLLYPWWERKILNKRVFSYYGKNHMEKSSKHIKQRYRGARGGRLREGSFGGGSI